MKVVVVSPTDSSDRESVHTLLTYYHYVKAWRICIESQCGMGKSSREALAQQIRSLPHYRHVNADGQCTHDLEAAYCRGMFTLSAMRIFPVVKHPELAPFANFWLPVQAYYAVHGVGLATLAAFGQDAPKDHNAFRAVFSTGLVRYFPFPIGATCSGGPEPHDFAYFGVDLAATDVRAQSNLAHPTGANAGQLVSKSLSTTREKLMNDKLGHARQKGKKSGRKRRNLPLGEKGKLANAVPPTTVCDFLYRMRVRANYDDPEMYLTSRDFTDQAVSHYADLLFVTEVIVDALDVLIQRKIGEEALVTLRRKVESISI